MIDHEFIDDTWLHDEFLDEEFEEDQVETPEQQASIPEKPEVSPPRNAKRKVLTDLISPKPKKVRKLAAAGHDCGVCNKKFSRSDNLKRHMTTAHG